MERKRIAECNLLDGATIEDVRLQATALIEDRRVEDAAAVLAHGRRRFPHDVRLQLDQASLAEATGDQDGAIELLQDVIDRHPDIEAAYLRAGSLYRKTERPHDAEIVLAEGMCWFPASSDLAAEYAAIAEDLQDWDQAVRRYRLASERFPSQVWAHARLVTALRKANRLSEASWALLKSQRQFPQDAHFAIEYAEIAVERKDWTEAVRRFEAVRERFPNSWWACKREADMLKRAGRAYEAEATLLNGQKYFPSVSTLLIDYAEIAVERQGWDEAIRRFEIARAHFPNESLPYRRIGELLRVTGRADQVGVILLDGQYHCPDEAALFLDHAELSAAAKDWSEALLRFEIVRDRFPSMGWPLRRIAQILRELDRFDEAEQVILEGIRRFPKDSDLYLDLADLKNRIGQPEEAIKYYCFIGQRFPNIL